MVLLMRMNTSGMNTYCSLWSISQPDKSDVSTCILISLFEVSLLMRIDTSGMNTVEIGIF